MYLGIRLSSYFVISLLAIALLPNVLSSASAQQSQTINSSWVALGIPDIYYTTVPTIANNSPTPLSIDVQSNDYGYADDAIPVVDTPPSGGTVVWDVITSNLSYTPNPNFVGTDSFTYQECDSQYCSNVATVILTVTGGSTKAPVGQAMTFSVINGQSVHIRILGSDPNSTPLRWWVTSFSGSLYGNIAMDPDDPTNQTLLYTPNGPVNSHIGTDSFTYTLSNGKIHGIPFIVNIDYGFP